jgi:hypothetical protein
MDRFDGLSYSDPALFGRVKYFGRRTHYFPYTRLEVIAYIVVSDRDFGRQETQIMHGLKDATLL